MQHRALILGGSGFISSHCVEALVTLPILYMCVSLTLPACLSPSGLYVMLLSIHVSCYVACIKVDAKYEVSIITRGRTKLPFPSTYNIKTLKADRSKHTAFRAFLTQLTLETRYDLVIDFICFERKDARDVIKGLTPSGVGLYVLISTDSVYVKKA